MATDIAAPRLDGKARSASAIARSVQAGASTADEEVRASLARIAASNPVLNAFTDVLEQRALRRAARLDAHLQQCTPAERRRWPLAGVPFGVKNLFDVEGLATLAGSRIERERPAAVRDAILVSRLENAGAILVGTQNMDEYAYGFTTENTAYGATRNPHDPGRIAGGSSGGSAAAVAAGHVPLSLGSDTNGSIRVPASLCGIFGLKPTFGRLPRTGTYPFVGDLDHLGPFAANAEDLALAYDLLQGTDAADAACAHRAMEPVGAQLARGVAGLRVARLAGYFDEHATAPARAAVRRVADALGARMTVEWAGAAAARAAAFVITNAQGAALHLPDLRTRAGDFEPLSRDRFLAGALLPAAWVQRAQRVRRLVAREMARIFESCDVLLAPATPCAATPLGSETLRLEAGTSPLRATLGLLTQPLSCIGLPVCVVPVQGAEGRLPLGVQVIAAPWREDLVLRVAAWLETERVVGAGAPAGHLPADSNP